MPTIFGPEWSNLTLADVQAYLDQADDEPLVWEAKGTELDKNEIRRQVCAFANSHEGGYLILGADRPKGAQQWTVDGFAFPGEPRPWVTDLISEPERGVRPRPDFDVAVWPAPKGHAAVVRIEPTSTPPCLANGTVYERLPGKSQVVRDPQRLADLFVRGDTARQGAERRADDAALRLLTDWLGGSAGEFASVWTPVTPDEDEFAEDAFDEEAEEQARQRDSPHLEFAIGVATTGTSPNIARRLFREDLANTVRNELAARPTGLPSGLSGQAPDGVRWSQEALTWRLEIQTILHGITIIRATWDGAVAIGVKRPAEDFHLDHLVEAAMADEWRYVEDLVQRLGGYGDVCVTVIVEGGPLRRRIGRDAVAMRRGPMPLGGVDDQVGSLARELPRALGNIAPEP